MASEETVINKYPSQSLYEKMYDAEFNRSLVEGLRKCSGDLIDFSMTTNFPDLVYFSRKYITESGRIGRLWNYAEFYGLVGQDGVWVEECIENEKICDAILDPDEAGRELATILYEESIEQAE